MHSWRRSWHLGNSQYGSHWVAAARSGRLVQSWSRSPNTGTSKPGGTVQADFTDQWREWVMLRRLMWLYFLGEMFWFSWAVQAVGFAPWSDKNLGICPLRLKLLAACLSHWASGLHSAAFHLAPLPASVALNCWSSPFLRGYTPHIAW